MKLHLVIFTLIFINSNIISQTKCKSDPVVVKYMTKVNAGENVQSCSLCASLAVYLCRATEVTNPTDQEGIRQAIDQNKASLKSMIGMGGMCCPELLHTVPNWASVSNSVDSYSSQSNSNTSSGQLSQSEVDLIEAASVELVNGIVNIFDEQQAKKDLEAKKIREKKHSIHLKKMENLEQIIREKERTDFFNSIYDSEAQRYSLANLDDNFILMISKTKNSEIAFSVIRVFPNSQNKLPSIFKLKKYIQSKSEVEQTYYLGLFKSKNDALKHKNLFSQKARESYVDMTEDINYKIDQNLFEEIYGLNNNVYDKWGNQIDSLVSKTIKSTTSDELAFSYYVQAQEAYRAGDHELALNKLYKSSIQLNKNPVINILKSYIFLDQQKYTELSEELDEYLNLALRNHRNYEQVFELQSFIENKNLVEKSEPNDWELAQKVNTIESYRDYLNKHNFFPSNQEKANFNIDKLKKKQKANLLYSTGGYLLNDSILLEVVKSKKGDYWFKNEYGNGKLDYYHDESNGYTWVGVRDYWNPEKPKKYNWIYKYGWKFNAESCVKGWRLPRIDEVIEIIDIPVSEKEEIYSRINYAVNGEKTILYESEKPIFFEPQLNLIFYGTESDELVKNMHGYLSKYNKKEIKRRYAEKRYCLLRTNSGSGIYIENDINKGGKIVLDNSIKEDQYYPCRCIQE